MRLGLIGDPVAHSASPALHRGLLRAAQISGSYEAICVRAGETARAIEELRAQGYCGLNVTTPLKEEAFERADIRDPIALASRAVNTLILGARIHGYNTDGAGALGALRDAGLSGYSGSRILVLGAGPTARAVIGALRPAGAAVSIWNRTAARAHEVARRQDAQVFAPHVRFDAVFATLPPGSRLDDEALRAAVRDAPILLDANYGERATLAAYLGRGGLDGLAMLKHSAVASFELWRSASANAPSSS